VPRAVVAANWKMNTDLAGAMDLAAGVREGASFISGVQIILCPPFISLTAVGDAVRGTSIRVGAQNMHFEASGAFTGEIAPAMLQGLCDYVILGHSERRQIFGEDDDLINRKIRAAFQHGLRPILCVGETLEQRESGQAGTVVSQQLRAGLAGVLDITGMVVAYEPVWAIGTGRAATPESAAEMMGGFMWETLRSLHPGAAEEVPLLYGGSVNPDNIAGFASQDSVHGALVGGASLRADQFLEIARLTAEAKGR
jgi:triosephosphate isomerase